MKKVIIIGAGPAGITAGYELLKNRESASDIYDVVILKSPTKLAVSQKP